MTEASRHPVPAEGPADVQDAAPAGGEWTPSRGEVGVGLAAVASMAAGEVVALKFETGMDASPSAADYKTAAAHQTGAPPMEKASLPQAATVFGPPVLITLGAVLVSRMRQRAQR